MTHPPLSLSLEILAERGGVGTLNDLVAQTEGRGLFLVIILLCLPFITPIPVPGLSNLVGLAVLIVAYRLFRGRASRLPAFIGNRPWPAERMRRVLRGSLRFVRVLERVIRPRRSRWLAHPWAVRGNATVLAVAAFLLALPVPPVMPFSNSMPAYAIIILSAAWMEEDGLAMGFAYVALAATLAYFSLFFGGIARLLIVYEERIEQFLRSIL